MNNTKKSLKVLFIGESWHIHMIHSKGYDSFTSSKYEEGATWLLQCLKNSQVDVTYMPAHTVQIAFPEDVAQLEQYDAIVISDIGSNTFLLQNDTFYQPEHPVIKGFSEYPFFLGYNRAIAKENAEVVLTINNAPLLVFSNYHNGKIACFMSDCSPHWGTQQFMSWPFYTALWVNILTHIAR